MTARRRINRLLRGVFLLLILSTSFGPNALSQILYSPENMGMGGGGVAYTTGYESLFINPANLYIQEKEHRLEISSGAAGGFFNAPAENRTVQEFARRYQRQFIGLNPQRFTPEPLQYDAILDRSFKSERAFSEHRSTGEIHWLGLQWTHLDKSYAVAVRSRFSNRYLTGRGYYDTTFKETNGNAELDRSLTHQFQSLHEISFGYAESFTFINRLFPQLSQLIIGIAPKFVISGAYFNAEYTDHYTTGGSSGNERTRLYDQYSTGAFTDMTDRFLSGGQPLSPVPDDRDLYSPTGLGAGFDLGMTYLITLGDDISVVRVPGSRTRKSLRLSFSVTDIGFVRYFNNPRSMSTDEERTGIILPPDRSEYLFKGRPGESFLFMDQYSPHPLTQVDQSSDDGFSALLPTALHAGVLFQVNRIKLAGDMSLGLTHNAFNTPRLVTYAGIEIRPLTFLPLRAGTRITRDLPDYYSLGAGIETPYFDLNAAIQFRRQPGPTQEITGFSVAGLKVYLP